MKQISHIILAFSYLPGSATVNRILGYADAYKKCGKKVSLVIMGLQKFTDPDFLNRDDIYCKEPNIPFPITRRIIVNRKLRNAIKRLYNPLNTVVHIYGTPTWSYGLDFADIDVFFEKTEIPYYSNSKNLYYLFSEWVGNRLVFKGRGVICISQALREYYIEAGVTNVQVVNMFVDSSRFEGQHPNNEERPYVLYCGSINRYKDGVDTLIKAFSIFNQKYPQYKLKLVGTFDRLYNDKDALHKLINDLKLMDAVEFTGQVPVSAIPSLLMGASILTLPRPASKQATYGFPTKLGEYLCSRKPIVVTNVGEIGTFIKDGENGFIVEPSDASAFAKKMRWIVENTSKSEAIVMEGYKLVENSFSSVQQTRILLDFYNEILC